MTDKRAWVTLATNDSYAIGALVLANSLKLVNTTHELAVLVTPGVSPAMKEELGKVFNTVKDVDVLDSKDVANLALLARPELGVTFTKLHCWNLTQYSKCVFLDADTLVVQNADELFERDELSAAPDAGWPDCFNSGVFVFKPNNDTFKALVDFAVTKGSFDGGDQGLLNEFFGDWATKDIQKHLPFTYNMVCTASYSYLPAFKFFENKVKILHFIGVNKPWLQSEPTSSSMSSYLELWWNIFNGSVNKQLSNKMIINCTVYGDGQKASQNCTPPPPPPEPYQERYMFIDPWEQFQNQPNQEISSDQEVFTDTENFPINNTTQDQIALNSSNTNQEEQLHFTPTHNRNNNTFENRFTPYGQTKKGNETKNDTFTPNGQTKKGNETKNDTFTPNGQTKKGNEIKNDTFTPNGQTKKRNETKNGKLINTEIYFDKTNHSTTPIIKSTNNMNETFINKMLINDSIIPTATLCTDCSHPFVESNNLLEESELEYPEISGENGLAGALGGGQRAEVEEQWRKQNWEQGNIDYMGKDSFENIWKKISQTVGLPSAPVDTSKTDLLKQTTKEEVAKTVTSNVPLAPALEPLKSNAVPLLSESPKSDAVVPNAKAADALTSTVALKDEASPTLAVTKTETPAAPGTPKTEAPAAPGTPKTEAPAAPGSPKTEVPAAPAVPKADVSAAPGTPKTEAPAAPTMPKAEGSAVPSTPKTEAPAAPAMPKAEVPATPGVPKTETPVEPDTPKTEAPAALGSSKTEAPVAPGLPKTEVPASPGTQQTEAPLVLGSPKTEVPAAPSTPKTEAPALQETPKADAPVLPGSPKTETPVAPGTPKSDVLAAPSLPKSDAPVAPGSPSTVAPAAPSSLKTEGPVTQGTPKVEVPIAPGTPKTEVPEAPGTPKTEAPVLAGPPKTEAPPAPGTPKTEAPATPSAPKAEAPAVPSTPKSDTPVGLGGPKMEAATPQGTLTDAPMAPGTPKTEAPASPGTPKAEVPLAPSTPKTEAPAVPGSPKTEVPSAPATTKTESPVTSKSEPTPTEPTKDASKCLSKELPKTESNKSTEVVKPEAPKTEELPKPTDTQKTEAQKPNTNVPVQETPKQTVSNESVKLVASEPSKDKPNEEPKGSEKTTEPTAASEKNTVPGTPTVTPATPGSPFPEEVKLPSNQSEPQKPVASAATPVEAPVPPKRKGNQKGGNGKQGKNKK
ncbi:proteoglycan 4-like isoform X2 [Cimex lectularius]|uniref:glycogenin glucosyltransferase n=1 Tax=Cimex lectularius TaxID=79782 RepID=A0A8I6SBN2_CIMLE|nr:proteoglycan 4-like isoform X2 [Cimex lectularius]